MSKQKKNKIAIIGDREINDFSLIEKAIIFAKINKEEIKEVLVGDNTNINSIIIQYCKFNSLPIKEYKADWKNLKAKNAIVSEGKYGKYNKRAAIDRDNLLIEKANIILLIGYSDSKTIENLFKKAKELNKEVFVFEVFDKPKEDLYKF